jgi:membrane associated rhomboid family serine protease
MAFRSNGPITLSLPPFRGATRKFILAALAMLLIVVVVDIASTTPLTGTMLFALTPLLAFHGRPWQFVTYALLGNSVLNTLLALFSIWISGSILEGERGGDWLLEYLAVSTIDGGLIASALSLAHLQWIRPDYSVSGLWPMALVLLLAIATILPSTRFRIFFLPMGIKAKHLAAAFIGIDIAMSLLARDFFNVVVIVSTALCAFAYLSLTPLRGLRYAASEGWFGIRNSYYRAKRRRAAKKFTVYMKKQGKDVSVDPNPRDLRDPNDPRWMN